MDNKIQENIWQINITEVNRKPILETNDFIVLYGGDVQQLIYEDIPKCYGNEYIILKILVKKSGNKTSTFNVNNIFLQIEDNIYNQCEDVILENHKLKPFCKNTITFGENEGYIIFEINKNVDLKNITLLYDDGNNQYKIPLLIQNRKSQYDSKKFDFNTNINISENIIRKQKEIELQILEDYNDGKYNIHSPYISINPYKTAPLTALILFNTEKTGKVSVDIIGKDENSSINHTFNDYNNFHEIPILGLYENFENNIKLTIEYKDGTYEQSNIQIKTEKVSDTVSFETVVEEANIDLMEKGITFFADITNKQYVGLDCNSEIRYLLHFYNWEIPQLFHKLENGNFLFTITSGHILEAHLIGKFYSQYKDLRSVHHDTITLPNKNILNTSHSHSDTKYKQDGLIELDYNTGEVVNDIDLKNTLNKLRFNNDNFYDWLHANSLYYCENDKSLLISARHQGVFKMTYPDGELKWITGLSENNCDNSEIENKLLKPIGNSFKPPVGQHSATIIDFDDSNKIHMLLFDNNCTFLEMPAHSDNRKYSRAVIYEIDEELMTIEEIWSYGEDLGKEYFCERVCNTSLLSNGNILINFGHRDFEIAKSGNVRNTATIIEVNKNKEVVYKLHIKLNSKNYIYRCERISLYCTNSKFTILNSNAEVKASNNYEEKQTEIKFNDFNENLNFNNSINVNSQITNIIFNDNYKTLDIKGFNMLENLNSDDYDVKLIFESEEKTANNKSINLKSFILSEMFKQIFRNQKLNNMELYENCMFSISIPYDELKKNLSYTDKYNIGIYAKYKDNIVYKKHNYFVAVNNLDTKLDSKSNLEYNSKSIKEKQAEILKSIKNQFNDFNYIFDNPLIILNPFNVSPLTALVGFKSKEKGNLEIVVKNKKEEKAYISALFNSNKDKDEYLIPIYGLYADFNNEVILKFTINSNDGGDNKFIEKTIFIKTDPLPKDIPIIETKVNTKQQEDNELMFATTKYYTAYDNNGDIRWYLSNDITLPYINCICRLKNSNLLIVSEKMFRPLYYSKSIYEIDFTGRIYKEYFVKGVHHEIKELENGDLMVACEMQNGERDTVEDIIVRIDRNTGEVIQSWDMAKILNMHESDLIADPTYTSTYLKGKYFAMNDASEEEILTESHKKATNDWFHMNSFIYNEEEKYFIVSGRMKDSLVKFSDDSDLIWILGDMNVSWSKGLEHKFLKPVGENFEYFYGQHNVQELESGNILIFDNGNFRSKSEHNILPANENFSRAVLYKTDEESMTVEQVWQYGKERKSNLYSCYLSGVNHLGKNHYLINFGGIIVDEDGERYNIPAAIGFKHKNVYGKCVVVEILDDTVIREVELIDNHNANTYRVEYMKIYNLKGIEKTDYLL